MSAPCLVALARVYDPVLPERGTRVLVDGLWPRGVAKDNTRFDEWCRDVAPSTELRHWLDQEPARFAEFKERYRAELGEPARACALERLRERSEAGALTLVTATREAAMSHAAVLVEVLNNAAGQV